MEPIAFALIFALLFSALSLGKRTYTFVALVYLLLLAYFFRGWIAVLCAAAATILVYQYRGRRESKTILDKTVERYPVQSAVILAGICRGMVARAPWVSSLIAPFSPQLAIELGQNPIGKIESMVERTCHPEIRRLVYAQTEEEIKHAVEALVGHLLTAKYTRAAVYATFVGTIMLGTLIMAPALLPMLKLFSVLQGR